MCLRNYRGRYREEKSPFFLIAYPVAFGRSRANPCSVHTFKEYESISIKLNGLHFKGTVFKYGRRSKVCSSLVGVTFPVLHFHSIILCCALPTAGGRVARGCLPKTNAGIEGEMRLKHPTPPWGESSSFYGM